MPAADNIIQVFLSSAAVHPKKTAITQDGISITFQELLDAVHAAAETLAGKGFRQGDKVLVFVPMSQALYITVLALFYIGAVPVFLDEWVSLKRMKACLAVVPCRGIIAGPLLLLASWFIPCLRHLDIRMQPPVAGAARKQMQNPASVISTDTALITFTTGSTGIPKAADRTHEFLCAQLLALSPLLQEAGCRVLTMLPVIVLLNMALGHTTVLPPRKFRMKNPATISLLAGAIHAEQADTLIASPYVLQLLLSQAHATQQLSSIQHVLTGGGPVYPALAGLCSKILPSANATAVYGSTEAEPICHIGMPAIAAAGNAVLLESGLPVGAPDSAATVSIIPVGTEPGMAESIVLANQTLPPGIRGEIIVKGAHVLEHYINNPKAELLTKIRAGKGFWHRTGDLGMLDGRGLLYLSGRCQDVIDYKGQKYYPDIVACILNEQIEPAAAVLCIMEAVLYVVTTLPSKNAEGISILQRNMLAAKLPESIVVLHFNSIPKDPRHRTKTDFEALRQLIRQQK